MREVDSTEYEARDVRQTEFGFEGTALKYRTAVLPHAAVPGGDERELDLDEDCLLYTSPSPRDRTRSRMPSSA